MQSFCLTKTEPRKIQNATLYVNNQEIGTVSKITIDEILFEANIKICYQQNFGRR